MDFGSEHHIVVREFATRQQMGLWWWYFHAVRRIILFFDVYNSKRNWICCQNRCQFSRFEGHLPMKWCRQ